MLGQTIGKYKVLDRVGRGGMGTVYRATDVTLHREVALKVLNAELNDPEVARRFRAEAITVARLSHPGIATIYELFQHDGQWLMVMEFVRGETLERLVNRSGPLAPRRAAELCMQALVGLAHAHDLGIVHRDLKPANLMINEAGAVKIMDFGIARVSGSDHLTNAGYMMGTPAYMAPEQVIGADVDVRADLYAMGVVFYCLTTAKLPFKGDTPFAMAQSQVNDPPTPVMLARPDLPPWVETLIARALAKAPKDRFQSAAEFHDAFARSLVGQPPVAPDVGSAPTELMPTPARTPLTTALATPLASPVPPLASPEPPPPVPSPPRKNAAVSVLVAVGALVVVGLLLRMWLGLGKATPVDPPLTPPVTETAQPAVAGPEGVERPSAPLAAPLPAATPKPAAPGPANVAVVPPPAPPVGDLLAAFGGVKLLTITGNVRRASERDVVVNFGGGQVSVLPRDGGAAITAVPYSRIRRATYVNARDPKWDATLAAPPAGLDVGTVLRRARAWLVIQTADAYAILRMDTNAARIVETLEARTGIKVERPAVK